MQFCRHSDVFQTEKKHQKEQLHISSCLLWATCASIKSLCLGCAVLQAIGGLQDREYAFDQPLLARKGFVWATQCCRQRKMAMLGLQNAWAFGNMENLCLCYTVLQQSDGFQYTKISLASMQMMLVMVKWLEPSLSEALLRGLEALSAISAISTTPAWVPPDIELMSVRS